MTDFDSSDPLDGQNRGLIPADPPPSTSVAAMNRLEELFGRRTRLVYLGEANLFISAKPTCLSRRSQLVYLGEANPNTSS
jgi:hypothetical protein